MAQAFTGPPNKTTGRHVDVHVSNSSHEFWRGGESTHMSRDQVDPGDCCLEGMKYLNTSKLYRDCNKLL